MMNNFTSLLSDTSNLINAPTSSPRVGNYSNTNNGSGNTTSTNNNANGHSANNYGNMNKQKDLSTKLANHYLKDNYAKHSNHTNYNNAQASGTSGNSF